MRTSSCHSSTYTLSHELFRAFTSTAAACSASTSASPPSTPPRPNLDAYPSESAATCNPTPPGGTRIKPRSGWRAVPEVPKFLGLTGLIPFYALCPPLVKNAADMAAAVDALQPLASALHHLYPISATLQIGYGTAIVSFLGAVHWGSAMQSRSGHTTKLMFERYVWSVTPALIVFPAAAAGAPEGSAVVLAALIATFALDAKFNWKGALPKWYMALRVPLTVGASLAMFLTMWHQASTPDAQQHGHDELQAVAMA